MKNLIRLMVIGMVITFVLVGCNNDDEANETSDNEVTEDSNEPSETTEEGETDEAEGDEAASDETDSSDSEVKILSLGETGTMETILGDFEVIPTSVQFLEKAEEDDPYTEPGNGVFIVVDITVKNIDDKALESSDIVTADLLEGEGNEGGAYYNPTFGSIENFEGEIAPGEEMSGQLLFDYVEIDQYQLAFGFALDTVSNEVRWEFTADEAE